MVFRFPAGRQRASASLASQRRQAGDQAAVMVQGSS
jgi:hypothetical protein